jgi:hypothetical protein
MDRNAVHPLRARARWPAYTELFRKNARQWGKLPSVEAINDLWPAFLTARNQAVDEIPIGRRLSLLDPDTAFEQFEMGVRFGQLSRAGDNIYVVSPRVRDSLGRTSLGGVRLGDLKLPYDAFYIGFDGGTDAFFGTKSRPRGWQAEGAYVNRAPEEEGEQRIEICLTSRDSAAAVQDGYYRTWAMRREPHYTFQLAGPPERTFEEALGDAIESGALEPDEGAVEELRAKLPAAQAVAAHVGKEARLSPTLGPERAAAFKRENLQAAQRGLALVLGAICALTARSEETWQQEWPDDAPRDVVEALQAEKSDSRRKKLVHELRRRGFASVRRIDLSECAAPEPTGATGGGRSPAPHWRAGHFRRQPCGTGRAEVRLVWILPTIVNGKHGQPRAGRIYHVDRSA